MVHPVVFLVVAVVWGGVGVGAGAGMVGAVAGVMVGPKVTVGGVTVVGIVCALAEAGKAMAAEGSLDVSYAKQPTWWQVQQ